MSHPDFLSDELAAYHRLHAQLQQAYDSTIEQLLSDHRTRHKLLELRAQAQLNENISQQLLRLSDPGLSSYLYPNSSGDTLGLVGSTPNSHPRDLCSSLFWRFPTPGVPVPDFDYMDIDTEQLDTLDTLWDTYFESHSSLFGQSPDLTAWTAFVRDYITEHLKGFTEGKLPAYVPEAVHVITSRRLEAQRRNKAWPQQWDHSSYDITITSCVPHDITGMHKMPYWDPSWDQNSIYVLLHTQPVITTQPPRPDNNSTPVPHIHRICVGFIHLYRNPPEYLPAAWRTSPGYALRAIAIAKPVRGQRLTSRLLQAAFDHLHTTHPDGWILQRSSPGIHTPPWFTQNMTEKLHASGALAIIEPQ